ncbi:MAG TPA: GNAT family N-acetyltransferase [Candidatus Dormibacteraeota bacterium]|nr:GNAT family N-acetyltransferase [Candidatus Dormibacteraeota bacterium]
MSAPVAAGESPMQRPTLRPAVADDAAVVAELLGQLGYPISAREALSRLSRPGARVILGEADGEALGLLELSLQLQITHARPVARVTAMVVRDSARRRGVGRSLMERAAELARAEGCEGIELTSGLQPEREHAHRFYEALGYERVSFKFWCPL